MHLSEQIFQSLSCEDMYQTLKLIADDDNYLIDYLVSDLEGEFLYLLELYNLVWIASDDRVLLTQKGEKVLQLLLNSVELTKKQTKLKYTKYEPKHKHKK